MNERIKKLRKAFDLTQQAFADRLGVKQNTIAKYETNRGTPTTSVISLIVREFNVSEAWLRTGEGDMFIEKEPQPLDKLLAELLDGNTITDEDKVLMKNFLELPDASRKAVIEFVQKCAADLSVPAQPDASGLEQMQSDIAAKQAELKRQNQELVAKVAALEQKRAQMEATAEIVLPVTPLSEADALAQKAAKITKAQSLSEKKPDVPASSAKESAAG